MASSPSLEPPSGSPPVLPGGPPRTGNGNGYLVSPAIRNGIAIVITAVWASTFIASIFLPMFQPSPFVHMAMLGLAAAVFGSGFVKGIK